MCHIPRVVGSVLQASSKRIKHPALNPAAPSATLQLSVNFITEFPGGGGYLLPHALNHRHIPCIFGLPGNLLNSWRQFRESLKLI